eukprot:COSAG02_NODE_45185_length_359_cov_1.000000_1_plen_61_part_10
MTNRKEVPTAVATEAKPDNERKNVTMTTNLIGIACWIFSQYADVPAKAISSGVVHVLLSLS